MCTLTFAWQVFEDAPLLVAANRDEVLDRPSAPPQRRDWEVPVVAPEDTRAGGTWLGYNEHGVVVAITNRWLDADIEGERSRGLLVRDALGAESAEAAVRTVERELDERTYDGFNLVAADPAAAVLVESGHKRRVRALSPGVHVVVNVGADGAYAVPGHRQDTGEQQAKNADAVRRTLRPEPGEQPGNWLDRAAAVLGDHEYGVCVHSDGFGTKSASLLWLGDERRYEFADGPPCETEFERVADEV
ncbi:NRDE family protein [Halovenus salina]|uniref:NRDE family protein n=1 Tax=Halovenus salina TaxID=1510225 RepID=A0ABD5VY77_9EURY|nr:NRDE family protein [Halovenus salina]